MSVSYRTRPFTETTNTKNLFEIVKKKACVYKEKFHELATKCDNDLTIPGCIYQTQHTSIALQKGTPEDEIIQLGFLPEAISSAKALLDFEDAKKKLSLEGVPYINILEISRQILDHN